MVTFEDEAGQHRASAGMRDAAQNHTQAQGSGQCRLIAYAPGLGHLRLMGPAAHACPACLTCLDDPSLEELVQQLDLQPAVPCLPVMCQACLEGVYQCMPCDSCQHAEMRDAGRASCRWMLSGFHSIEGQQVYRFFHKAFKNALKRAKHHWFVRTVRHQPHSISAVTVNIMPAVINACLPLSQGSPSTLYQLSSMHACPSARDRRQYYPNPKIRVQQLIQGSEWLSKRQHDKHCRLP